ncbi:MAG TPA: DNA repair protein RecO [Candidatus Nanoarchaeia archaeon]|nr:DNA repair protein RecO [Candidatus Nanoarchaeia archaeon]
MEQTFNTKVLILNRCDFREADSRIVCYSADRGKLELVARGAKKLKSKLSGHLEPLTLSRLMIVVGKDFNYVGTATGENFYPAIKNNLEKINLAVQALSLVEKMTRENEIDGHAEIFNLLKNFLDELENHSFLACPAKSCSAGRSGERGGRAARTGCVTVDSRLKIFSKNLSAILGFSPEDFEELRQK